MKSLIVLASRLYPKAWRARYGKEFAALLEDSRAAGARELLDVLKGAAAMRMKHLNGWELAAACGAAGMILMAALAIGLPNEYTSTGTFGIDVGKEDAARAVNQAAFESLAPEGGLRQILDRNGLESLDLEKAKKRLSIRPVAAPTRVGTGTAVSIAFDSRDAVATQAVARDYMKQIMNRLASAGVTATAIDEPRLPDGPMWPNRRFMIVLGLLGGLICGGFATLVKRRNSVASA